MSVRIRILVEYGNRLIIIDEVHNINITSKNQGKQIYLRLKLLLDIVTFLIFKTIFMIRTLKLKYYTEALDDIRYCVAKIKSGINIGRKCRNKGRYANKCKIKLKK